MTLQVESLQPGEDRAARPAADPVWHPWYYPGSRSIPGRRGQLEAFCLHLLQFMNPPSGAQSRLCLWVSVTGQWGQEKKKKDTILLTFFLERRKTHTETHIYFITCEGRFVRAPLRGLRCSRSQLTSCVCVCCPAELHLTFFIAV